MTSHDQNPRNILSARRLTLLGSAAIVGAALVFGGVGTTSFTAPAFAATTQTQAQGPAGFADLIAKVKPAVISVRVKMDRTADASDMPQMNGSDDDEGMPRRCRVLRSRNSSANTVDTARARRCRIMRW